MADPRPGDPADRAMDVKADGAFGGLTNHRGGYGDAKLARLTEWLRANPTATLAAGEGAVLLAEIDRLRAAAKDNANHYAARAERILAALREPSVNLQEAAYAAFEAHDDMEAALKAAVAAAEQEVERE